MHNRIKSFTYAFNGFKILLKEEPNARIHLVISIVVIFAGFYFSISQLEWIAILLCIALVFAMEIINSSIENLADFVSPQYHQLIKKTKDLAAAAVFFCAIISVFVGIMIFGDKILLAFF